MVEKKDYAIGALTVALLVSLGFAVQPDDTHFCSDLEITMQCNRLSSTEKTCYPTAMTTVGKKYCSSGWESIIKELSKPEVTSKDFNIGTQFSCNTKECIQIK